jgi:hypothetical protein
VKWAIVIALAAVCALAGPSLAIWALNTLFGTAIPYTRETWIAALVLMFIVGGQARRRGA